MQAVHSTDTVLFFENQTLPFTPGSPVYQTLQKNTKSVIACNVVSYSQIEGHILSAMAQNAILVLEIARSQLEYALNEEIAVKYIKEIIAKTNCQIPIILHGDHVQYTQKLFDQKKVLAEVYQEKIGQALDPSLEIKKIDLTIMQAVQEKLKQNIGSERQVITDIIERLIKAGFTSIAIDASTIFDEIAGDAVLDYYAEQGTEIEKMIIALEKSFALSLEWGAEILKLDILKDKNKFDELREDIIADMKKRGKSAEKIAHRIEEMERVFGVLTSEAQKHGFAPAEVNASYDKITEELARATIAGELKAEILNSLSENEKLLILPTSNAEQTAWQIQEIRRIASEINPSLRETIGIEVEVGHVDKKVPNPRLGGKMESKVTHPMAVKIFGEYLKNKNLRFDLIATNNGSGHGTEFDKETLVPISQVDKISPFLTSELQAEALKVGASLAQHGTSGSDMDELSELSRRGVIKFNIATNYQQIVFNVLSLLHDDLTEDILMDKVWTDQISLMNGLAEKTRENIKDFAQKIISDTNAINSKPNDSLFTEFLKKTYAWGVKKGKITADSSREDIATLLAKEFKRVLGEMDSKLYELAKSNVPFRLGYQPETLPENDFTTDATSITAVLLTKEGWRGKAIDLDKNIPEQKAQIAEIKDASDGLAKRIYEKVVREDKTILMIRASEGFSRDGVAESFKANDLIMPEEIIDEVPEIKKALDNKQKTYTAKSGEIYKIENAIIDVVENTNSFVVNGNNKKINEVDSGEAGASSIIVIGDGVESLGDVPDYYTDSIFTLVKKENRQDFLDNPLDPEIIANDPTKQEEFLQRIAKANDLEINDLELVLLDRERENARINVMRELQKKYSGLEITMISDGSVAHSLMANLGRKNGKHKVVIMVSGAAEGFYNLSTASVFKEEGAIGSLRIYSQNVNKTTDGNKSQDLAGRYNFDEAEIKNIQELRPKDAEDILNGKKLFTQEDVQGEVSASFSFITHNGVFGVNGAEKLPQDFFEVTILRVKKINGKPSAWFEKKVVGHQDVK